MIIKNILGKGAEGLLRYLSRPEKSHITTHTDELRIPPLHQPYLALASRVGRPKPAASVHVMPTLSKLGLDDERVRTEVLLPRHARAGLESGRNERAKPVRRSANQPSGNEQPAVPFLSNMAGQTPKELAREVGILRRLRPNLTKAVSHLVLSHDPKDRQLTETEWSRAVEIALEAHGASEAAFAAYRHHDTEHQHLHILFCRVLPSGDVVSDSHNWRKNETAARLIEQEFQLNSPIPTPVSDKPGDREALANARRRAERRGTPDPTKINAKSIREALGQARDRDHFQALLKELGVEIAFDRRGQAQDIYGWRLRRQGADEWIKGSTLAKDLSWPKIAHRLEQSEKPALTGPVTEATPARIANRIPVALKPFLQRPNSAQQMAPMFGRPEQHGKVHKPVYDLQKMQTQRVGPLSTAMLILGGAMVNFSVELVRKIIDFMRAILARFGIAMRPVSLQKYEHPSGEALEYEPLFDVAGQEITHSTADAAAEEIIQIVDAAEQKRPDLLPEGEGRAELMKAMNDEVGGSAGAAAAAAAAAPSSENPLDEIFGRDEPVPVVPVVAVIATPAPGAHAVSRPASPAAPQLSPWLKFSRSVEAWKAANAAVERAQEKGIFYDDDRAVSRKRCDAVRDSLQRLDRNFSEWKKQNKFKSALGADPLKFGPRIETLKKQLASAGVALGAAIQKHKNFENLWLNTPPPVVPQALTDAASVARAEMVENRILLISKAQQNLQFLAGNPLLQHRHLEMDAKIKTLDARFDSFLSSAGSQAGYLTDLEGVLRELNATRAQEQARLASQSDDLAAQIQAPGQR